MRIPFKRKTKHEIILNEIRKAIELIEENGGEVSQFELLVSFKANKKEQKIIEKNELPEKAKNFVEVAKNNNYKLERYLEGELKETVAFTLLDPFLNHKTIIN